MPKLFKTYLQPFEKNLNHEIGNETLNKCLVNKVISHKAIAMMRRKSSHPQSIHIFHRKLLSQTNISKWRR